MIILTGAFGFLGKSISNYFITNDFSFLTIGRNDQNQIKCDLSNEIPNFQINEIDLVVHVAGKAHSIPKNKKDEKYFYDVNYRGTQNLLRGLDNSKLTLKSFIFISSVAVYGIESGTIISEDNPLSAKDPYGLSKLKAEQLVLDWCKKNNVICTILRLPLIVGKNPPGNLGAMVKAIRKGYYFNLGGGKAKKSMVLAEDVAEFLPIIALIGGIYNLTDGEHPSFLDLSKALTKRKVPNIPVFFAKIFGFLGDFIGNKAPINSSKVKKITSNLTFDDSKARAMGWKSKSILEYLESNGL